MSYKLEFKYFGVEQENINIFTIIVLFIILIFSIIPFVQNYKYNDNHLNWLNHDYAKNLMICSEQESVFMTEGGDNQVFGSLYFIYAEKLRPDLSPYDQKGNIFKRIYGDMRYIDPQTLERRMNLVDKHLFDSQEPFYVNIRDRADPYFIPYWQGDRSVYLTWQRPNPWSLGDYYYKRYGIMYKVQKIEYQLVDYLLIEKELTLKEAKDYFSNWLNRPIDDKYTLEKVKKLESEGLVKLVGDKIQFVKMYPTFSDKDYFSCMILRWKHIPNAMYWDYLSREIIINYDYQMGEILREEIDKLSREKETEKRPEIKEAYERKIKELWEKAKEYYEDAIYYGGDSLSVLHNISVVFLRNGIEDLDEKAYKMLNKALTMYKNSWGTYQLMFSFLIMDTLKNPENEKRNLDEADKWMNQLKRELSFYRSSRGNYQNHQLWRNFQFFENFFNQLKQIPTSQLITFQNLLDNMLKNNPNSIDNLTAQQTIVLLYSRGFPLQYKPYIEKADYYFENTLKYKENDANYLGWAFQIAQQLQRFNLAYDIGKKYEKLVFNPNDYNFIYQMGMVCYYSGKTNEAKSYMNKFLDIVKEDRKLLIQLREQIDNARKIVNMK